VLPADSGERTRVGDYRLLGLLGRGGMGVVYRARDPQLNRDVAVKVLLPSLAADPQARCRFLRECRAAAALTHENIVAIHQVGESDGIPFLVMELLAGTSLHEWCQRGRKASLPQILRIGRDVARGLAAAHAAGLVHRDIKPGNLWLEKTQSSGFRVKILDFGLARPIDGSADVTRDGHGVGTPHYVAPEQAAGRRLDGRADLFSLGCVLYELCTDRLPFPGNGIYEAFVALATVTPPSVRPLNPDVPPALDDLIMRLLDRDPAGRPATAAAVEEELRDIGRSVKASASNLEPVTVLMAPVKGPGRRRWRLVVGVLVATLLSGVAALFSWGLVWSHAPARDDAGAPSVPAAEPARPIRLVLHGAYQAHTNEIRCLAYSSDGRYLATGSFDQTAVLWNASTMQVVARLLGRGGYSGGSPPQSPPGGVVEAVAFSADSATLATAHSSGEVCLWRVADGHLLGSRLAHPGGARAVAFAPPETNGWALASGGADGMVCLWPLDPKALPRRLAGHKAGVDSVAVCSDGTRLASSSADRTVRVWDARTGASLAELHGFTDRVSYLVFAPKGRLLATADADEKCVRVWDLDRPGAALQQLRLGGNVHGVAFSADGKWVATASQRSEGVALWDVATGRRMEGASGQTQWPWAVACSPDGTQVAAGDFAILKIWKVQN
jgi:hypothetical protein